MDHVWAQPRQINHHVGQFADNGYSWIADMDSASDRPWQKVPHVKPPALLCRRSLTATAIGGGAAWLIGHVPFVSTAHDRAASAFGWGELATLCSEWSHPETVGRACLKALPATDASIAALTRMILRDMQAEGRHWSSESTLADAIRERSRDDFRGGRIVSVDGWMLSLTETRVYALAALISTAT